MINYKIRSSKVLALLSIFLVIYLIIYMTCLAPQRYKRRRSSFQLINFWSYKNALSITPVDKTNPSKYSSWRRLSPHKGRGIMEGSCVTHGGLIWTLGGIDCTNLRNLKKINSSFTNVYLYDYKSDRWHPGPSLNSVWHHAFSSAFSVGNRIVIIGGLREAFDRNLNQTEADPLLLELDTSEMDLTFKNPEVTKSVWRSAILPESFEKIAKELGPIGMTACTQIPTLDGKHYCYIDTDSNYIRIEPRFMSIKFRNTSDALNAKPNESVIHSIERLSIVPNLRHSHATLLVDNYRNEIIMLSGRYDDTKKPYRECYSYSISTSQWVKLDYLQLPESLMPYEARGFIQFNYNVEDDFSLSWLLGGQDCYNNVVTHEIWAVKIFRNPAMNNNRTFAYFDIYPLDLLPAQLFSSCVMTIPNQNQNQNHSSNSTERNLLVLSGSGNVGPYCSPSAYEWTPPSNKLLSKLPADVSTKPNCSQIEFYTIESARFGIHDVTEDIKALLLSGIIHYPDYLFKVADCHHFHSRSQSADQPCHNQLSITIFDKRLQRRYRTTCIYPSSCRLIYC